MTLLSDSESGSSRRRQKKPDTDIKSRHKVTEKKVTDISTVTDDYQLNNYQHHSKPHFDVQQSQLVEAAYQYGKNMGICFQLVDDILDFSSSSEDLGKPAMG